VNEIMLVQVPKPKSVFNPNRPVSALLKAQMEHLRHAASNLPLRYRSEIYINAVKTEGEAAEYIRDVTEAIHEAHADAAAARARIVPKPKRVISIAAVADERAERKQIVKKKSKTKAKKSAGKKKSRAKTPRKK
jgi:hypothetical protein